MTIKDFVFDKIRSQNGMIDVEALAGEIRFRFPQSKWNDTHWSYYRSNITSAKGRYFDQFSDEIRNNLTSKSGKKLSTRIIVEITSNDQPVNRYNFRFEDRTKEFERDLAKILARSCYHMHPSIVKKIADDNASFKYVFERIGHRNLNLEDYFFEGSDCVFPGIRRSVSKEKVGLWKNNINEDDGCVLNDNTYPRHIWTFLCSNKPYSSPSWIESGLSAFELAHIFAHKIEERAFDLSCFQEINKCTNPYALFTSASNTVLIPKGLTKPTDKSEVIKIVFFKRHLELYGNVMQLPGLGDFKEELVPEWYAEVEWNEPVLPADWEERINNLLTHRNRALIGKYLG